MSVVRAILLWAVMLAIPFQGYAAASMVFCAPDDSAAAVAAEPVRASAHDHAGHHHADAGQEAGGTHDYHHPDGASSEDSGAIHKCGTCGACHAVALLARPPAMQPHLLPSANLTEPFIAVADIAPRVLDKPPRA